MHLQVKANDKKNESGCLSDSEIIEIELLDCPQ
jgi:hypothetical protein